MTDNPVRTLATLALAACLALGLLTPADAAPPRRRDREPTVGGPRAGHPRAARPVLRLGTRRRAPRAPPARAALPRPQWDPSLPQGRECTDLVCLHYVGASGDAPPMASSTGGTPDWVALTLGTAHASFARMAQLGWPLPPERPRRRRHPPVRRLPAGPRPARPLRLLRPRAGRARRAQRRVVVLRARQRLRRVPPAADPQHAGDGGARALPRRPVRARRPRGRLAPRGDRHLDGGAGHRRRRRQPPVPRPRPARRPAHPARHLRQRARLLRQLDLLPAPHPALRHRGGAAGLGPRRRARRTPQRLLRAGGQALRRVPGRLVAPLLRRLHRRQPHRRARRTPRGRPTGPPRRRAGSGSAAAPQPGRGR